MYIGVAITPAMKTVDAGSPEGPRCASQAGSQSINWWSMTAGTPAAILPLIVIGIVLENYVIKGMSAGAVK